jgi:hypothetical protein
MSAVLSGEIGRVRHDTDRRGPVERHVRAREARVEEKGEPPFDAIVRDLRAALK